MIEAVHDNAVDLRALRALVMVADVGSFRAAAASLGYTQSAISHQIATLEHALGTALFIRPGGRAQIRLTPAGDVAYRHARRALNAVDSLRSDARIADGQQRGTLRLGVPQTVAAELLPAALATFRGHYPGIEVTLSDANNEQRVFNDLASARLDLAFVVNPTPNDRVEAIPLLEDPWVILTRNDSPLALNSECATHDSLDGANVVAWSRRWAAQIELERAWRQRNIAPRIIYRTDDNLALQRLVAAGLGHACIGRLAARHTVDPNLVWLNPYELLAPRSIALLYPRERKLPAPALALIDSIQTHLCP